MTKPVKELQQVPKQYSSEFVKEMQEIMHQLEINGEEVRRQLAEVEKELTIKRNSDASL